MAVRGLAGRDTVRVPGRPLLGSAVSAEPAARSQGRGTQGRATRPVPRSEALSRRRLRGGQATASSSQGRQRAAAAPALPRPNAATPAEERPGSRALPAPFRGSGPGTLTSSAHGEGPATGRSRQRRPKRERGPGPRVTHRLKCSMIFSSRTFSGKLPTQRCLVSRTMLGGVPATAGASSPSPASYESVSAGRRAPRRRRRRLRRWRRQRRRLLRLPLLQRPSLSPRF